MPADHMDDIEGCEQRLVNLWPAVTTMVLGPWALRLANGYSGRANSASALWRGAELTDAEIAHIVQLYRQAGLQPAIRLTPLADPGLEPRLEAAGWQRTTDSLGMVADVSRRWAQDPRVTCTDRPTPAWLTGVSFLQEARKRNAAHLEAIVGRIHLPASFATVEMGGAAAGYGMVAVDRGWAEIGSIILAPEARGQGLGRALVTSLLAVAAGQGATKAFLQVEGSNGVAIALYRKLGFAPLYDCQELRLPG